MVQFGAQGPIPGENFTSDTKNYPWHRPPQFTNLNEAFEYIVEQISDEDVSTSIVTMLELGVPVSNLVDMIITAGVGGGKFTVDFGLLLCGPLSHVICLMARRMEIDPVLGVKSKNKAPTKAFFDALERDQKNGQIDIGQVGADLAGDMGIGGAPEAPADPAAAPAPSGPPSTGLGGKPPVAPAGAPVDQVAQAAPPEEQEQMLGGM